MYSSNAITDSLQGLQQYLLVKNHTCLLYDYFYNYFIFLHLLGSIDIFAVISDQIEEKIKGSQSL